MLVYEAGTYNMRDELIADYFKRKFVHLGSAKRDQYLTEGRINGFRIGMREALAKIATDERCTRFFKWGHVPGLMGEDFRDFFEDLSPIWDEYQETLTQARTHTAVDPPQRKVVLNQVNQKFWSTVDKMWTDLVLSEDLMAREIERHQAAVIAGKEEATAADGEWLARQITRLEDDKEKLEKVFDRLS